MRLLSLYMQAQGLGYSTVLANRAGGQSTVQDLIKTSPQGATAFPVKRKIILNLLCSISLNWIIQGCAHGKFVLIPSPACGRGAGERERTLTRNFFMFYSLSLALSHKCERGLVGCILFNTNQYVI